MAKSESIAAPDSQRKRLGDFALFILYAVSASGPVYEAVSAVAKGHELLAIHYSLVSASALIIAGLFLIRRKAVLGTDRRKEQLIAIIGSFTIIPLGWFPVTRDSAAMLQFTSLGLVCCHAWIVWSLLTLRRSFSIFPEARSLITHGPYGIVRHPLYLAYFVTYTLVMLPRFGLLTVVLTAIGIAAEINRSRNEERILRRVFPEYERYAQRVRAFIPVRRRESLGMTLSPGS